MKLKVLLLFITINFVSFSQNSIGLKKITDCSQEGYVLFAPLFSKNTYLIDKCGREVHKWTSAYTPAQSAYFLPNGNILRPGNDTTTSGFTNRGGIIEILNWKSEVIWSYRVADSTQRQHHDVCAMPNGNILVLVYHRVSGKDAAKQGRDSSIKSNWIWSEKIIELKPVGKNQAKLIWEWRAWEHLIQDFNKNLPNYGVVSDNPQRININFKASNDEDWLHFNSIDYNEKLDQILISNRNFSEVFILDHSTLSIQTASYTGGKQNKGGDLIYRWGNPQTYKRGTEEDRKFFSQHNARWIKNGLKDEGKIIVFNNGYGRPGERFSTVEIINPLKDNKNIYLLAKNSTFLPTEPDWTYGDESIVEFYSSNVSSAQRLSNGNTLVCEGEKGVFFEIDKLGEIVWTYINPVSHLKILENGSFVENNQVFRCYLYESNYPGFSGKSLSPSKTIEEKPSNNNCKINKQKAADCNLK